MVHGPPKLNPVQQIYTLVFVLIYLSFKLIEIN